MADSRWPAWQRPSPRAEGAEQNTKRRRPHEDGAAGSLAAADGGSWISEDRAFGSLMYDDWMYGACVLRTVCARTRGRHSLDAAPSVCVSLAPRREREGGGGTVIRKLVTLLVIYSVGDMHSIGRNGKATHTHTLSLSSSLSHHTTTPHTHTDRAAHPRTHARPHSHTTSESSPGRVHWNSARSSSVGHEASYIGPRYEDTRPQLGAMGVIR